MLLQEILYRPIGIIHSPFRDIKGMPIQPIGGQGIRGMIELETKYVQGLKDIEGFSHLILIYYFHLSKNYSLIVTPFLDDVPHGVFATRAPKRPHPIGLSVVKLIGVEGQILHIEDVDIVDGTPWLDINPYVPEFDHYSGVQIGWLKQASDKVGDQRSDSRFVNDCFTILADKIKFKFKEDLSVFSRFITLLSFLKK